MTTRQLLPPIDKPPYSVPMMTEIAALPWNGLTVASTFSGCGGSSLGYRMAGFKVVYANEFVDIACDSYRANAAPYTYLDNRDIRTVMPESLLELAHLNVGELDLLDGSPPCMSFSTAGSRHKGWGKVKKYVDHEQRSDDLFFEYTRLLKGLQPKTFVAENVSGLIKGIAKGYFIQILAALKECGYRVSARLLNAAWLGVPQARQRIIFVGVRNDIHIDPVHPLPLTYWYTVADAIPLGGAAVIHDISGQQSVGLVTHRPSPTIMAGRAGALFVEPESKLGPAAASEWDKMQPGTNSSKYFNLGRAPIHGPSQTVVANGGNTVTHPTERRKFSIAELRRICSFPDDFILIGSYAEQWMRLGNSVPPVMMKAIAERIRDDVLLPYRNREPV